MERTSSHSLLRQFFSASWAFPKCVVAACVAVVKMAFGASVAYAINGSSTFVSTQLANGKLAHTDTSLHSRARASLDSPRYLTDFPQNNMRKQGEHSETELLGWANVLEHSFIAKYRVRRPRVIFSKGRFCLSNTNGRRDRHDIVAEILETARGGAIKTRIMSKAKLSYGQVSEYIPLLLERGFLENHTVGKHRQMKHLLKTTEQGERFLENFRLISLLWSESADSNGL